MSYTPIPDDLLESSHDQEPILSQKSFKFGMVNIYAPNADPEQWGDLPWLLTSEFDADRNPPGMRIEIKAECVMACLERPYFIGPQHMFDHPAPEEL